MYTLEAAVPAQVITADVVGKTSALPTELLPDQQEETWTMALGGSLQTVCPGV